MKFRHRRPGRHRRPRTPGLPEIPPPAAGFPALLALPAAPLAVASSFDQVISNTQNWIIAIAAALATLFLTIGGVQYLTAGSDPAQAEKAKAALRSAAIGYAIAILAPLIVQVLKGWVGA